MKYLLLLCLAFSPVYAKYSQNEIVAAVIIAEAGGEGDLGMRAVASVIQNRTKKGRTPLQVVMRKHQFECITRYLQNTDPFVERNMRHPRYERALVLAKQIASKSLVDVTGGADHFFNDRIMPPSWASKMTFKKKIGGHSFYKS